MNHREEIKVPLPARNEIESDYIRFLNKYLVHWIPETYLEIRILNYFTFDDKFDQKATE